MHAELLNGLAGDRVQDAVQSQCLEDFVRRTAKHYQGNIDRTRIDVNVSPDALMSNQCLDEKSCLDFTSYAIYQCLVIQYIALEQLVNRRVLRIIAPNLVTQKMHTCGEKFDKIIF